MDIKKLSILEIRKLVKVFIRDESGKLDKNTAKWNLAEVKIRGAKKLRGRI